MSELASESSTQRDTEETVVRGAAGMPEAPAERGKPSIEDLEEAMRDVVDPELGINVVDLGLVYGIQESEGVAVIDMTLVGEFVDDIKINWVWMPPWGPDKITEDGREQLRALGFRV